MARITHIIMAASVSVTSLAIATTQAIAQSAEVESDEIVVTANKREQRLQDVGVAVSVLGNEAINQITKQDISALARMLPAVQITPPSSENTIINIRGVAQNDPSPIQEMPVAFYSDGVYIASSDATGPLMFDVSRLEVLRGPQGTLFGRNSTGGLIQIYSEKPTSKFGGYASVTVGNFDTVVGEAAVGGPITDRLRGRISFITRQGGAYVRNLQGRKAGGEEFYAGRLQLAGDVGDSGEFTLKVEHARNENDTALGGATLRPAAPDAPLGQGRYIGPNELVQWVGIDSNGPFTFTTCPGCDRQGRSGDSPYVTSFANGYLNHKRRITNISLNYKQDLGGVELTSISDYMQSRKTYVTPVPYVTAPGFIDNKFWQASQEFRLSKSEGHLRWTAGVYGLTLRSSGNNYLRLSGFGGSDIRTNYNLRTSSLAVFGQAEYDLTDQFTAIGGLRYGWDWQKYSYLLNFLGAAANYEFTPALYPNLAKRTNGQWSGKFELDYKPSRNVLFYASVNRGTKAGSFNQAIFGQPLPPPDQVPFREEILTNYEGGVKLTLLDNRAHFNLTAFHYDYKDYQAFQPTPTGTFIVGNIDARMNGVEFDADIRPVEGVFLQAFGGYLDAKALDVVFITAPGVVLDRRMPNTPKWTFGGMAKYDFAVAGGRLAIQGNVKYNSSQYFTLFNEPVTREPGYAVVDARISYTLSDPSIELALFANNLTDKQYRTYANDDSGFTGNARSYYAKPRYYGVSLRYSW